MRLILLEPQFIRHEVRRKTQRFRQADGQEYDKTGDVECHIYVETVAEAQGIIFLCPKCYAENKGPEGTHSVLCWFKDRGVPLTAEPGPARWTVSGNSYDDLTLSPSVLIVGGCAWHGFVTAGAVTSC